MRNVRDAILLAAGRGTRMGVLTEDVPKPMLPIAGRPLLERIVRALSTIGIERIVCITGYRAERIEDYFESGAAFGLEIRYVRQTERDGTARALLLGRQHLENRPFVLGWGDILTDDANYRRLVNEFAEGDGDGVLAVNWVEDPHRGAAVTVDDAFRITRIVEKPPPGTAETRWHNAGLAVFAPLILEYAGRVPRSPRGEYEIPDAISTMIADGRVLRALPLEGFWSDVGTPEDLEIANGHYLAAEKR